MNGGTVLYALFLVSWVLMLDSGLFCTASKRPLLCSKLQQIKNYGSLMNQVGA